MNSNISTDSEAPKKDVRAILDTIKKRYGIKSDASLSTFLGIKPNTLSGWVSRSMMDYDLIFSKCEDIDGNYLLSGIGTAWKTPSLAKITEPTEKYTTRTDVNKELQTIPLYDFKASAGLVSLFNDRPNVLDHISIPNLPKCDGAISITGDSMYPLLKAGDIVCYKIIGNSLDNIFWGEMYLLACDFDGDELAMVKFVQKSDLGPDYIKLVSQNSHHDPKHIKIKNVKAMALIKASIRLNSMA